MPRKSLLMTFVVFVGILALLQFGTLPSAFAKKKGKEKHEHKDDDNDDDRNDEKDSSGSRVQRGFEIAPVPLNLHGKNRALVGLGSYIVNAQGGCNDCHTWNTTIGSSYAAGANPFAGQLKRIDPAIYLSGGRVFGPFVSANITPDASGKPAGLTLSEFITLIRTGHDPDDAPGALLQVMPWPVYQDMVDRDLRAIYEYLSSIPSLPNNPKPGP